MIHKELHRINQDLQDLLESSNPGNTYMLVVTYPEIVTTHDTGDKSLIQYLLTTVRDTYDMYIGDRRLTRTERYDIDCIHAYLQQHNPNTINYYKSIPITVSADKKSWTCPHGNVPSIIADADFKGLRVIFEGTTYMPNNRILKNMGFYLSLMRIDSIRNLIWDGISTNPAKEIVKGVLGAFKATNMHIPSPTWGQLVKYEYLESPHNDMVEDKHGMGYRFDDEYTNYLGSYTTTRNWLVDTIKHNDGSDDIRLLTYATILTCLMGLNDGMSYDAVVDDIINIVNCKDYS